MEDTHIDHNAPLPKSEFVQGTNPAAKMSNDQPMNPTWLLLISPLAGLTASAPIAGAILYRCGYRRLGWIVGSLLSFMGIVFFLFAIFWGVEWYWTTLSLTTLHLLFGTGLSLFLRKLYRNYKANHPSPSKKRGSYREIIAGMAGGALISAVLGTVCIVLYLLLLDRLLSTLVPVNFQDEFASFKLLIGMLYLVLSGLIAGGMIGRNHPRINPGQMITYGFALLWTYLTWLFLLEILIAIPGFQADAATGRGLGAMMALNTLINFLIGFWWVVFLLFYMMSPAGRLARLSRAVQVLGINLAVGLTLSISFGYSADAFLALGRHFERKACVATALRFYELGLKKEPEARIASYLQYRVALLNHRLRNGKKAKQGFKRVVSKYTGNPELVKKANRFLDNLDRSRKKKRVVLPGVETRTEYKGGYCVPNSLALAMRYWGSNVTARRIGSRITGLGSGTIIVNQSWYAEQAGFRHDFLPMASLDDIKQCIDAGFPVLVYVPAHVFAIVGYDEDLETFVSYDVATNDVWVEYLQKDFIKAWKKQATTLVLGYPEQRESSIPAAIRARLKKLSDNYLHYHLHYLEAPAGSISTLHLLKAAGETGEFFFPLTILYNDFPGLRKAIAKRYDTETIIDSMSSYFMDNFDEGTYGPGQYHEEKRADPDWRLKFSIDYLIGYERFDVVEDLITRIDEEGQISDGVRSTMGMIHLVREEFDQGMDQLMAHKGNENSLYLGLTHLKMGNEHAASRELVKTVSRCI